MQRHFSQVVAVDEHPAPCGFNYPEQSAHQGGFAAAGSAHDAYLLLGLDGE